MSGSCHNRRMINIDRASVERHQNGVTVDDPESPWIVDVNVAGDPTRITSMTVRSRPGGPAITAPRLSRLPTAQLAYVAGTELLGGGHQGEDWYRMLATPKPAGTRDWPQEHWDTVRAVASWAIETERPGGAGRAVADLWGVTTRTAWRWLKRS